MSETITTYHKDKPAVAIPMDREEFYEEQLKNHSASKKPERIVEAVAIFIFDSSGEIYIQKRSDNKKHNAGMLDKTIGGHIRFGDSNEYTVMVETVQELQVPSITLRTDKDFLKTYDLLRDYLNTVAIIKHVDTKILELKKNFNGKDVPILNKLDLYFGVYDGAIKTVDREAKGVLLYSFADLENDIKKSKGLFTDDLKILLLNYYPEFEKFLKIIKQK